MTDDALDAGMLARLRTGFPTNIVELSPVYWKEINRFQSEVADRVEALLAALKAEGERAGALHNHAKALGNALLRFTPGGSEYFVKIGDDYYADAETCARVIQRRLDNQFDEMKNALIRARKAEAAALPTDQETTP